MNQQLLDAIRASEKAIKRLLDECRKNGPVYADHAKAAAQVNRTGKWLLNATATLQKELGTTPDSGSTGS